MAVGFFVFPAKSKEKDYEFSKDPRKILEVEDRDVVLSARKNRGICYYIRWDDKYDGTTDKEMEQIYNEMNKSSIELSSRRSGQGYTSTDKEKFVRIIRHDAQWFKQYS